MRVKFMVSVQLLFLLMGFFLPETMGGHFMIKDIALAAIIGGLLKPKLVPLPIPFPLPITFRKHVRKPYPIHPHGYSGYDGGDGGSYDFSAYDSKASGTHALAQLQSASENIDSILQQLSSSDIIKDTLYAPSFHNSVEEYNNYDDFTNFSEDWWRK